MTTAHRGLIGIAGLLWALQGCFNPTPPAGVLCAPDGWCPSGQRCDPFTWMCVVGDDTLDAGTPWTDSGWPPWPEPDASPWPDAGLQVGIDVALMSYGPVNIQIPQVLVTYVKPPAAFEIGGFFVQTEQSGPALFVGVDPNLGGTRLREGDRISFRILEMSDINGLPMASYIDTVVIHGRGESVSPLIQDITDVPDVTFNGYDYAAELVGANVYILENFIADGVGYETAWIMTNAVVDDDFRLRVSQELQEVARLESDCTLSIAASPLWRYYNESHLLAHELGDLQSVDCPRTRIQAVTAETSTQLRVQLGRGVDPATLLANGSQFVFDGGLTATSATVSGRTVTVTTTQQVQGQTYTLTVANSLRDVFGKSLEPGSVNFAGIGAVADMRINEVKANIDPGCDLLELRVVTPGDLLGFDLRVQNSTVLTFTSSLPVDRNDLVVVHFGSSNPACRPSGSGNETQTTSEQPRSVYPSNFDTAYDWYTPSPGPPDGPAVLAVRDDEDRILDAVLLTDGQTQDTSPLTEDAAALVVSAGQWQSPNGGVPPGGFVDAAFHDSAAGGINVDPANVSGGFGALDGLRSVQRSGNGDTDRRSDWTAAAHTFGVSNAGQSPL